MGPFIRLLAETYGLPESSVAVVARTLREDGWLTTGARGVNAPDMTALDAARLTLALMSGQPPSRVVADFEVLRGLQTKDEYPPEGLMSELQLEPDHRLEETVTRFFRVFQEPDIIGRYAIKRPYGWLGPFITISVDNSTNAAQVDVPSGYATYTDLAAEAEIERLEAQKRQAADWTESLEIDDRIKALEERSGGWDDVSTLPGRGMRVIRRITHDELRAIADAMAESGPPRGEPAEETPT